MHERVKVKSESVYYKCIKITCNSTITNEQYSLMHAKTIYFSYARNRLLSIKVLKVLSFSLYNHHPFIQKQFCIKKK